MEIAPIYAALKLKKSVFLLGVQRKKEVAVR